MVCSSLSVNALAATDDYGSTASAAYSWTLTKGIVNSINGIIETSGDVDYFKFTVPFDCSYKIYSTNSTVDPKGWLYGSDGVTQLASDDDGAGYPNFLMTASLSATEDPTDPYYYYIKVGGYSTGTGKYTLSIEPVDDYGDTTATAYNWNLTTGATNNLKGILGLNKDVDMFKLTIPVTGSYEIISSHPDVDVKAWLCGSDGVTELANNDDGGGYPDFKITYTLTKGQTYYLKVSHYNQVGTGGSGIYTLHVKPPIMHKVMKYGSYQGLGVTVSGCVMVDAGYTVAQLKTSLSLSPIGSSRLFYNSDSTLLKTGMGFDEYVSTYIPYYIAVRGDVDCNGVVDENDMTALRTFILNLAKAPAVGTCNFYAADMDGNGTLNVTDIVLVRKIVLYGY